MKFVCYTDWDQLPENANVLFAHGEKDSIFFSRPWFENLDAVGLDHGEAMVLACVLAENKVMAILPLMKGTGNIGYALKHRYTTHYSLLLGEDNQMQVLTCLCQGLSEMPLRALLLEPVASDDIRLNKLLRSLEAAGYRCSFTFRFYNWIYRVQGQSYKDYMAARPTWLVNTIYRKKCKFEREHGFEIRLYTGDEVPRSMSDYYAAYNASWKANEQYVNFLDGIVAGFSRPGWTRLAVLYVKEKPIAAQLWFVLHGKASIFRLAYDKAWKPYSPGSILTGFMMEYVIDTDKVEEIDFLAGNDSYKKDWMSDRRERFVLSCVKNVKSTSKFSQLVETLKFLMVKRNVNR